MFRFRWILSITILVMFVAAASAGSGKFDRTSGRDSAHRLGTCVSDADCDDGAFCNGSEMCGSEGACQRGPAPCLLERFCDEQQDDCPLEARCETDDQCDDALFCTGIESCVDGHCSPGKRACDIFESCDEDHDACDPIACQDDADCEDLSYCNGVETCSSGSCSSGNPPCLLDQTCDEPTERCVDGEFDLDIVSFMAPGQISLSRIPRMLRAKPRAFRPLPAGARASRSGGDLSIGNVGTDAGLPRGISVEIENTLDISGMGRVVLESVNEAGFLVRQEQQIRALSTTPDGWVLFPFPVNLGTGTIQHTVVLEDADPDEDRAIASTTVVP